MVNYRGYLIHFRSEVLSWRFMAAPASPELPILSRGVSRQFSSRDEALAEARNQIDHLLLDYSVGFGRRPFLSDDRTMTWKQFLDLPSREQPSIK